MPETLNQATAKAFTGTEETEETEGSEEGGGRYGREEPARQDPSLAWVAF